jgi:hypothetical protein
VIHTNSLFSAMSMNINSQEGNDYTTINANTDILEGFEFEILRIINMSHAKHIYFFVAVSLITICFARFEHICLNFISEIRAYSSIPKTSICKALKAVQTLLS